MYSIHNYEIVSISITHRGVEVHSFISDGSITPSLDDGTICRNVWKIMKSMKPGERSICTVRDKEFRDLESAITMDKFLLSFPEKVSINEDWIVTIEIITMFKIDDIYGDGVLTKKTIKKGNTTAKADKVRDYL